MFSSLSSYVDDIFWIFVIATPVIIGAGLLLKESEGFL